MPSPLPNSFSARADSTHVLLNLAETSGDGAKIDASDGPGFDSPQTPLLPRSCGRLIICPAISTTRRHDVLLTNHGVARRGHHRRSSGAPISVGAHHQARISTYSLMV